MKTMMRWAATMFAAAVFSVSGSGAFASGNSLKQLLLDNEDPGVTQSGTAFSFVAWQNGTVNSNLLGPPNGEGARKATGVAAETGYLQYDFQPKFGSTLTTGGTYNLSAYVPNDDDNNATGVVYRVYSAPYSFTSPNCGAYTLENTYNFDQQANEGRWGNVGNFTLGDGLKCIRVQVSNQATSTVGFVWADALNITRLFESRETIVDMPRASSSFAANTSYIASSSNGAPTVITTLSFTCPKSGVVTVTATGESAAVSGVASGFIGLAYSISKNSTATDNANVVQSSSLATFVGDANRDFLVANRFDSCTAGESITYRLTAYKATAGTVGTGSGGSGSGSFLWNARLVALYTP
jgi:hypothetical protein